MQIKYSSNNLDGRIYEAVEYVLDNSEHYDLDAYREWLDEIDEPCKVGNLQYSASQVLEKCDPVAFEMCYNDDYKEGHRESLFEEIQQNLEDGEYAFQCPKCSRSNVEDLFC